MRIRIRTVTTTLGWLALLAAAGCAEDPQVQTGVVKELPDMPQMSQQTMNLEETMPAEIAAEERLIRAQAGVGKKGRGLENTDPAADSIVQPARTLFHVQQKAVFDFQIPQAMNLYRAEHGRFPTSFDEFKKKILEPNRIELPELPDGHEYEYDAKQGQLMVRLPG